MTRRLTFAYFGARILHARMIAPLAEAHLPLRVKNIFSPAQSGTLVSSNDGDAISALKAVTSIHRGFRCAARPVARSPV